MDFLNFKISSKLLKKMSLMSYFFFRYPFSFSTIQFLWKNSFDLCMRHKYTFACFIWISWIFFSIFEFRRCHFFEHDGMLRELFYCLWRGSNMSVVCTEDEIIFIYLECVLRKMAKNFVPCDKKFITLSLDIRTLFRYYKHINKIMKK